MTPYEQWRDQGLWPPDTPEHVFLARALLVAGMERHGEQRWRAMARPATPYQPLPANPDWATPEQMAAACRQMAAACPGTPADESAVRANWTLACGLARASYRSFYPATKAFEVMALWLAHRARDGELATVSRPYDGGPFTPLSPDVWNADDGTLWDRFAYCALDPARPFDLKARLHPDAPCNLHWIFVEAESLARALAALQSSVLPPEAVLPLIGEFRGELVSPESRKPLPGGAFLSLPEAVTWILFGEALTPDTMRRRLREHVANGFRLDTEEQARLATEAARLKRIMTDECATGRTAMTGIAKTIGQRWADGKRETIESGWFADHFEFSAYLLDGELIPNPPLGRAIYGRCQIAPADVLRWQELFDTAERRRGGRPANQFGWAREALSAIYPDGVPENVNLDSLHSEVNAHLKPSGKTVSRDTVRRARN